MNSCDCSLSTFVQLLFLLMGCMTRKPLLFYWFCLVDGFGLDWIPGLQRGTEKKSDRAGQKAMSETLGGNCIPINLQ